MNLVDQYCLDLFPELKRKFTTEELETASSIGSYIFHEDLFPKILKENSSDPEFCRRLAQYLEYLCSNQNRHLVNLAEIGVLPNVIVSGCTAAIPYLGENTKIVLRRLQDSFDFDAEIWLRK